MPMRGGALAKPARAAEQQSLPALTTTSSSGLGQWELALCRPAESG
jgi:hypothetical protein